MTFTQTKGRSCDGKKQYSSRQAAENAMAKVIREGGAFPGALNTYRSRFGTHWHYGHLGRRRR